MAASLRPRRARVGIAALTIALLVAAGVVPGLARSSSDGPARDMRNWMHRAIRAFGSAGSTVPTDTVVVYGPRRATTPTGAPTTTVELFGVPQADSGRRYLLKVENGASDGGARVTSGSILVNTTAIVSSAELAAIPRGGALYKPVVLKSQNNSLLATVSGPADAYATMSVVAAPDPTFTVWGPKTYEQPTGMFLSTMDRFTLPAGGEAPSYLYVVNGDGLRRSAAVTVKLNGVEIVGLVDVNLLVAGFVKPITLQQNNVIEVETCPMFSACRSLYNTDNEQRWRILMTSNRYLHAYRGQRRG